MRGWQGEVARNKGEKRGSGQKRKSQFRNRCLQGRWLNGGCWFHSESIPCCTLLSGASVYPLLLEVSAVWHGSLPMTKTPINHSTTTGWVQRPKTCGRVGGVDVSNYMLMGSDLPTYFFSNSPVKCLLTKVVFPVPPSPTNTSWEWKWDRSWNIGENSS